MSILTRIAQSIGIRPPRPRSTFAMYIPAQVADIPITEETSLALSSLWAVACVTAETIATLPFQVLQADGDKRTRVKNHPADNLMNFAPNDDMNPFDWIVSLVLCEEIWGGGFATIERKRFDDSPISAMPVYPSRVCQERDENDVLIYKVNDDYGHSATVQKFDMFHLKGPSIDGLTGLNQVRLATKTIGLALAAEKYGINLFSQGCRPSGTLEVPQVLDDIAFERLKADFANQYCGMNASARVVLLENGVKFNQVKDSSADDSQMLGSRQHQAREICGRWRVPPHKIGDLENAHFTNIEHQEAEFIRNKIIPLCIRFEQEFNRKLLTAEDRANGIYGKFNLKGLLRGDYKSRAEGLKMLREAGVYSANDIRRFEDEDPISPDDGGDDYWRPANILVAGEPVPEAAAPLQQSGSTVAPEQAEQIFAGLAMDALHRCLRKESKALERIWPKLLDDAFYSQHVMEVADAIIPILNGLSTLRGDEKSAAQLTEEAKALGRAHVAASRKRRASCQNHAEWHAQSVDAITNEVEAAILTRRELADVA